MHGLQLRTPTGPASRWLSLVWEWAGYHSEAAADRILPHGLCEVSWELRRGHRLQRRRIDHIRTAALIGPATTPYWVETPGPMHLFGLLFRPGAARSLMGTSVEDLRSCFFSWGEGGIGKRVVDLVGGGRTWSARADAAVSFFAGLPPPKVHRATTRLLQTWSESCHESVAAVRSEVGVSGPTFTKHVREDLGLRPAELRQLLRFRGALQRIAAGQPLSAAALDAGYADQAHMSRAFRRFAGLSPTQVRPRSAAHPFHLPETRFPFVQEPT